MLSVTTGDQIPEEVADLIRCDRESNPDIDAATITDRNAAVDADDLALIVKQRPAGVPRVDRGVDLNAV